MPLDAIRSGERHRWDMGDIAALARSIGEVGLLHPVTVTPDGVLVDGARRLEAVRALGWREVPVHVVDLAEVVRGEHAANAQRKDFTPSEMVAITRAVAERERMAAAARQRAHLRRGARPPAPETFRDGDIGLPLSAAKGEARDRVAGFVGVSGRTVQKATAVVEAAERDPARYGHLVGEMDRSGRVDGAYMELRRLETWHGRTAVPAPAGTYRTIVCDPPWRFDARAGDQTHRGRVPYAVLSVDEIIDRTPRPAASDCLLWLWATNAHLHDAFHVLEAWGFTYRGMLTWVKAEAGVGDWLRGQTEHCLLASRGALRLGRHGQSTVLMTHRRLPHSEKPAEFYALVEKLSPAPYIDVYARTTRPGWAAWGNEVAPATT